MKCIINICAKSVKKPLVACFKCNQMNTIRCNFAYQESFNVFDWELLFAPRNGIHCNIESELLYLCLKWFLP